MAKSRIQFRPRALQQLMTQPAVVDDIGGRAKRITDQANAQSSWGGYDFEVSTMGGRARARMWNYSDRGAKDESRNNRLIRTLDAGR